MKATKASSFISGMVLCSFMSISEIYGINFIWSAILFFPTIFIFVIGSEATKKLYSGENFSLPFYWPANQEGWQVYRAAWVRMFIWFIGGASAILLSGVIRGI